MPVSYTHLDVYKRQVDNLRVLIDMVGITGEASMMSYLMEQYHQRFAVTEKKKKFEL